MAKPSTIINNKKTKEMYAIMETTKNQVVIVTANINSLRELFGCTNESGLIAISDHYWLVSHETNPNSHLCSIADIMESDIRSIEENDMYCDLIDTYGKDLTSKFVHLEQAAIEKKTINLVNFAFDKIYKSNELEIVLFPNGSDIQETVINAITNNFTVSTMNTDHQEIHISVKR